MGTLETTLGGSRDDFPETVWSTLLSSAPSVTTERQEAMNRLAQQYWRPIYKFIRASRRSPVEDAKDLSQEFFTYLLEGDVLSKYEPEKGRFRTFLKAILRNFLMSEHRDAGRLKRGGGQIVLPLDVLTAETPESAGLSPEESFDQEWEKEIITESLLELRRRLTADGRAVAFDLYEAYHRTLSTGAPPPTYGSLARDFSLGEPQVQNHLAQARHLLEAIMREQVARRTVSPGDFQDEIRDLLRP